MYFQTIFATLAMAAARLLDLARNSGVWTSTRADHTSRVGDSRSIADYSPIEKKEQLYTNTQHAVIVIKAAPTAGLIDFNDSANGNRQ